VALSCVAVAEQFPQPGTANQTNLNVVHIRRLSFQGGEMSIGLRDMVFRGRLPCGDNG
jgi:hypothetical protein